MIYDSLDNFQAYISINPLFQTVFQFIKSENMAALKKGKISLTDGIQAIVDEYETKDLTDTFIECHKKYIDIQVTIEGVEQIGICPKNEAEIITAYDQEKDYEKLACKVDLLTLKRGFFAIFFPQDGHAPGLKINNETGKVKKIVFKVPSPQTQKL